MTDKGNSGIYTVIKRRASLYDCAIECKWAAAQVVCCVSVLGHRQQVSTPRVMSADSARQSHLSTCAEFQKKRLEILMKHFEEVSLSDASVAKYLCPVLEFRPVSLLRDFLNGQFVPKFYQNKYFVGTK